MTDVFKYDVNFWEELELQLKCALPPIIKHIVRASGYENIICLRDVTKDDLDEIEKYVNKNLKAWLQKLRDLDDDYVKLKTFKFLPGLRKIILKISEELKMKTGTDIF